MKKPLLVVALFIPFIAFANLQETASALDETIKSADTKAIAPSLAEKVGVQTDIAKTALIDKKLKLSELALAKFVSERRHPTSVESSNTFPLTGLLISRRITSAKKKPRSTWIPCRRKSHF